MKTTHLLLNFCLLLCLTAPADLWATASRLDQPNKQEFTKTLNKRFTVGSTGDVKLDNSYGRIDYDVWEKNEVRVSVSIIVNAASESKAQEIFDQININFSASSNRVDVSTEINSKQSSWSWGPSKSSYEINYRVQAPASFNLELFNKYGDVAIANLQNNATLEVKYGDLKTGNIQGKTNFHVAYGSASLGALRDVDAEIRYSDVNFVSAQNARIDSKYSETKIKRLAKLILESQYDEFVIGSVGELINSGRYDDFKIDSAWSVTLETRYTDVVIGYLAEDAAMQMRYGDAHISNTSPQLTDLALEGNYTDFTVRLDKGLEYELKADARYANIDLPAQMKIVRKEKSGSSSSYQGVCGTGRKAKLVLLANYGSISVR